MPLRRLLLALLVVPALAAAPRASAQAGVVPAGRAVGPVRLDVPYVDQGPLLCGGAAVAMVARFWGARGIHPEQFAHLVRPEEGGIRTGDLADAARARGWRVREGPADAAGLERTLRAGVPVLLLLHVGGDRYHFVVLTGWDAEGAVVHDPARNPSLTVPHAELRERWERARRWSLVILPSSDPPPTRPSTETSPPVTSTAPAGRSPEADSLLVRATAAFRADRYGEAAELAGRAAEVAPDGRAWRIRATALYLAGYPDAALEAWNRGGEPRLDLVRVTGLRRTPHRAVTRRAGLRPGRVLTPDDLLRARRRLSLLPALEASRVGYRPVGGGLAEAEVAAVEAPTLPTAPLRLAETAASALARRTVEVEAANLLDAGEAYRAGWRWQRGRERWSVAVEVPLARPLPAVATVEGGAASTTLDPDDGGDGGERRLRRAWARAEATDWATPVLRWTAGAGAERWDGAAGGTLLGGVEYRERAGRAGARLRAQGWGAGLPRSAARLDAEADARAGSPAGGWTAEVAGGVHWTSAGTPPHLWPTAGSDPGTDRRLRAHPLVRDGVAGGPGLAPRMAGASVEGTRWLDDSPLLDLGLAAFADVLRSFGVDGGRTLADAGVGLRLGAPGLGGYLRVDLARGLADDARALSVGWEGGR